MSRKEARDIIHDIIAEGFPVGDRIFSMDEEEEAALRVAMETLQERPLQPPFEIKTLADSTLMSMTKAELVEYVRMCEKNAENAYAQIDQQAKNIKKLLDEQERPKGRCECCEDGRTFVGHSRIFCSDNKFHKVNYCLNCGAPMVGADMRESEQE